MLPRTPLARWQPLSPEQTRRSGGALLVLGLLLMAIAVGMLALAIGTLPAVPAASGAAEEPSALPLGALGFLAFVGVAGSVAAFEGASRLITGRRSERLTIVLVALGLIFLCAGLAARAFR